MAPAICGVTLKRPGSLISASPPSLQAEDQRDLAFAARIQPFLHDWRASSILEIDAQARLDARRRFVERLRALDARAHFVALHFAAQEQDDVGAGLERVAIFGEAFGK